jgi:L-fucose isomerase-like protein
VRIGSLGARPQAFNTVRYSEKILEGQGITVEPIDLSEVFGRAEHMKDHDPPVEAKLEAIREYVSVQGVPPAALLKMAKLSVVIDNWMRDTDLAAISLQCWTSMEEYFGVVPCAVMSMMSNNLLPSACEVDVCGAVSMYALALASETPSALLDWNNNYADDPDKAVCFHCSNLPKHFFETVKMGYQQILAGSLSKDRTYGALEGQVKAGAMTFARFSTDDNVGKICGYIGEGEFTKDPLATFGGAGVVRIARLEQLLRFICENGLEHHVAASFSSVADALYEAATRYLNWNVYRHN